ncbi:uncharacterized protein [Dysidea avara]|uniref:uncharacterized protein isoform X2 n=1 Tax=Dysidea avara TaxID=196820 RepID=UPI003316ED66
MHMIIGSEAYRSTKMAMSQLQSNVFLNETECNTPAKSGESQSIDRKSILLLTSTTSTVDDGSKLTPTVTPVSGSAVMSSVTFTDRHTEVRLNIGDADIIDARLFLGDVVETLPDGRQSTSHALKICNQTIVAPYRVFLKLIGWRKFSSTMDLHESRIRKVLNILYPSVIFLMILLTLATRAVVCFDRTQVNDERINGSFSYIECNNTPEYTIYSVIIIVSYLLGLYLFRIAYPEYLVTLIEKVFLNFADNYGKFSQKKLLLHMRYLFGIGVTWMMFSIIVNILRVKSLRLLEKDTYFEQLTSYNISYLKEEYGMGLQPPLENYELRVALVLITVSGFTLVDLLYLALVMNYALQCQLIFFAVCAAVNKFRTIHYQVDAAIKEIRQLQDFLVVLNGKLASLISLELFIFAGSCIQTLTNLSELDERQTTFIIGVCEFFTSFTLLFFVVMQAVRVTVACAQIKLLGLELRARPFAYARTHQIELDSFLLYTSSITMNARLIHIPMKPLLVAPVLFSVAVIWRTFFNKLNKVDIVND